MECLLLAFYMIVGTYTDTGSYGIYSYRFDPQSAAVECVDSVRVDNPSYLVANAAFDRIYAVSEGSISGVATLSFDARSGKMELLGMESTLSPGPCHVTTDGRLVITANYGGGSLSVFNVEEGGILSPAVQVVRFGDREHPSHMHCVKFSPDGRYLFATDLGHDLIRRFDMERAAPLQPLEITAMVTFDVPAGSGPRHIVFDPAGDHLYLINELSGFVTAFRYENGNLAAFQSVESDTAGGHGSADIVMTSDGKYLYTSNRLKDDGIASFRVDGDGSLARTGYMNTAAHPRAMAVAPGDKYLLSAARHGNVIEVFGIDPDNGTLTATGRSIRIQAPVCILFIPERP